MDYLQEDRFNGAFYDLEKIIKRFSFQFKLFGIKSIQYINQ